MNYESPESLRNFSIFKSLSPEKLAAVFQKLKKQSYPENHTICSENEIAKSMFFIVEGKVLITKKGVPLANVEQGNYFGEMSLLESKKRDATVVTVEPTTLLELPFQDFRLYIIDEPSALLDIAITFDMRLRQHNLLVIEQYLELKQQYQELDKSHFYRRRNLLPLEYLQPVLLMR